MNYALRIEDGAGVFVVVFEGRQVERALAGNLEFVPVVPVGE